MFVTNINNMSSFKKFEEIVAWQKARELNKLINSHIENGKFRNSFRLINQIEGSAGSIMDNIAEGFERSGNREFVQFLYISKGSCGEFRSQLYRALDRDYLTQEEFKILFQLAFEIARILQTLINYLVESGMKGTKYKARE